MSKMSLLADTLNLIAQTAPAGAAASGPAGAPSPLMSVLPFILMIAGFWFLVIAPQRKKQKEHEKMVAELQSGDEVVTNGGIYGVITNVKDDRFVVRIADNTKIELGKAFITTVIKQTPAEKK
jgi:preprotein translocase subunit YajC